MVTFQLRPLPINTDAIAKINHIIIMAQACKSCFDNKTTQDGAEECSIFSPQEHRATKMNVSTHYFEDVFATVTALQLYLLLPPIIEMKCYGHRIRSSLQSKHVVCQMQQKDLVRICFHDALSMINKERTEQYFRIYVHPKPELIYVRSWYEKLWSNQDWLQLVQVKVVQLRHRLMGL